jgi:peroxiredoxin
LQLSLPRIESLGARLVVLSPQLLEKSVETSNKNEVAFDILSDVGNIVANQFGLVFTMPEKYREMGKKVGLDLLVTNGDDSGELPLTATYIIDTDGIIAYAFIDTDYTKRMEPEDIVEVLQRMIQEK